MKTGINCLLVMASLLAGTVLVEMIYRPLEPSLQRIIFMGEQYAFFQYDPLLGWSGKPGVSGVFLRDDFNTHIHHNAQGMRYHEIGPKKTFRVAVLGDSYTWGHGVEEGERYSDLIEQRLPLEMLNFGVEGYGTVQEYLQLDRVLPYKPDLVLIAFCLENDFGNNGINHEYGNYKPYAVLKNNQAIIKGYPVAKASKVAKNLRPYAANFALGRFFILLLQKGDSVSKPASADAPARIMDMKKFDKAIYEDPRSPIVTPGIQLTEDVLRQIKRKLDKEGIKLLVVAVPSKIDISNPNGLHALKTATQQTGISLVYLPASMDASDFFIHDAHWNKAGHEKMATFLMPILNDYMKATPKP